MTFDRLTNKVSRLVSLGYTALKGVPRYPMVAFLFPCGLLLFPEGAGKEHKGEDWVVFGRRLSLLRSVVGEVSSSKTSVCHQGLRDSQFPVVGNSEMVDSPCFYFPKALKNYGVAFLLL